MWCNINIWLLGLSDWNIINKLNYPDLAEKREQKERIDSLESQLKQLMEMNQTLMARLSVETNKNESNESLGA